MPSPPSRNSLLITRLQLWALAIPDGSVLRSDASADRSHHGCQASRANVHPSIQKAMDAGLISWSGQKPVLPPPVKVNDGGPLMSDIVIEDRG